MKSSRLAFVSLLSATAVLFVCFSNCSEVAFETSPDLLKRESMEQASSSGILIDGGADFTNQSSVQLKLESPRALEMKISEQSDCSDGSWEPYSTSKLWHLKDSNSPTTIYASFKDLRGNTSPCIFDDITHDNEAPKLSFAKSQGEITNEQGMLIGWTASDNLSGVESGSCLENGNQSTPCADQHNVIQANEGNNHVSIRLKDRAGNTSEPFVFSWMKDTTPPSVTLHSKPSAVTGSAQALFSFAGSDQVSGLDQFFCRIGQGTYQSCDSPHNVSGLSEGAHHFEVYAVDKAGNKSSVTSAQWEIDLSAPEVHFTQTPSSLTGEAQAIFAYEGSDDGQPISIFECRLDSAGFSACGSSKTFSDLTHGLHSFEVRGIDSVGNRSEAVRYQWSVDTQGPQLNITSSPSLTSSTQASFQWTAVDAGGSIDRVECRIDGGSFSPCPSGSKTFSSLAAGAHKFELRAFDQVGNSASASRTWTIDLTAPVATITSGPNAFVSSLSASLSFSATDASGIQGFECRLDSGSYSACSSPKQLSSLYEGGHLFFVRAIDKAGNVSTAVSYSWVIDRSAPLIRIISSTTSVMEGDSAYVEYEVFDTSSGVQGVECGLSSPTNTLGACGATGKKQLGVLAVGQHSFEIRASDKVGNTSVEVVALEITARPMICDPFTEFGEAFCDGGMVGEIYYLSGSARTHFTNLSHKTVDYFYQTGTKLNALLNLRQMAVSTRDFTQGFPSTGGELLKDNDGKVLDEYFAFRMESVLKLDPLIDQPGWYQFATISDDGSVVLMKPSGSESYQNLIENDGDHSTRMGCSTQAVYIDDTTRLPLEIKYYQGPRTEIAMMLMWRKVSAMNSSKDAYCGAEGTTSFFGPKPYQNFTSNYLYGKLTEASRGWKLISPTNFIAPLR